MHVVGRAQCLHKGMARFLGALAVEIDPAYFWCPRVMPKNDASWEDVLELVREARSFDFRNYKRPTLKRRIERRMAHHRLRSVEAYLELLRRDPGEFDRLIASMLIKVTSFFRDPEVWDEIRRRIIPKILEEKNRDASIRVWCAGCSTGEEVYSMAALLAESIPEDSTRDIKVFGTDVDESAISFARRGIYSAHQVESIPPKMLDRWFSPSGEGFAARKEIRHRVVFGINNLVSDAPISRLDIIVCRNVFIYLDAALQRRVLSRFHYALRHSGALVLGRSELIPFAAKMFEAVDLPRRIYVKDGSREVALATPNDFLSSATREAASPSSREPMPPPSPSFRSSVEHLPLPCVATSQDGTVLAWNRAAAKTWGLAAKNVVGRKLATLALPCLSGPQFEEKSKTVRAGEAPREVLEGAMASRETGEPVSLRIEATLVREPKLGPVTLYVAQEVSALRTLETHLADVAEELRKTNDKLLASNERLGVSNEELETTNEELQSANEELQTTNEELQSTNEELETINEELQSTNAELDATNRELAHRTQEMRVLSIVQRTIIRSLSAAVIVLDPAGRITSWNLAAERLLRLPEAEALGQLVWSLRIPALRRGVLQRVRTALDEKRASRQENVPFDHPAREGGRGTLAAVPVLDEGFVRGAVILFEDTTSSSTKPPSGGSPKRARRA